MYSLVLCNMYEIMQFIHYIYYFRKQSQMRSCQRLKYRSQLVFVVVCELIVCFLLFVNSLCVLLFVVCEAWSAIPGAASAASLFSQYILHHGQFESHRATHRIRGYDATFGKFKRQHCRIQSGNDAHQLLFHIHPNPVNAIDCKILKGGLQQLELYSLIADIYYHYVGAMKILLKK